MISTRVGTASTVRSPLAYWETISSQAFAVLVFGSFPLFLLLQQGGYLLILFLQLIFALAIAVTFGVSPALLVELYPPEDRLTSCSLAYESAPGLWEAPHP